VRDELGALGPVRTPAIPDGRERALDCADAAVEAGDIVIGHSLGGILALRLARERPRPLQAVVLTGCFFPPARNGRGLGESLLDYGRHRIAFARSLERGPGAGRFGGTARGLGSVIRLAARQAAHSDALAAVTTSVLVVHARDDHLVPVDFALAAVAREPGWALRLLDRGGHSAQVHEPARWLAAVMPWLTAANRDDQAVGGGSVGSG
jgi:pimeloyl-ACP methyl ester carboxylesterase